MFTGIVETAGRVAALDPQPAGKRLRIDIGAWRPRHGEFAAGDSVCVSGVCLTLVNPQPGILSFDVIHETLAKSRLGAVQVGQRINLESSLTAGTSLGGHFVQGHVDGTGKVTRVQEGDDWRIAIGVPQDLMRYMIPKGSVALDGVSMTLAAVRPAQCEIEVAVIPTTLEITTLGELRAGAPVNLEADVLSKTIVHYLENMLPGAAGKSSAAGGVTTDLLRQAGFLASAQDAR